MRFDITNLEIPIRNKIWGLLVYNMSGKLFEPKTSFFGPQPMGYSERVTLTAANIVSYFS